MSHEPLAFLCRLSMEPPSPSDKAGDADRLLEGLERRGLKQVAIPLSVMRRLPEELRKCRYEMDVVIGPRDGA